ncbi:hypothetical protein AB205_0075720 [Aquarana catesbeiana]|uniref:Uncharacterized protein n=1 Tax=Aquarana catesbeiana TaxID=8400 RepID=A0A2G9RJH4_AQUCT|nr:hypothetical protein AB205_0075720 [Aquarana catesbeiana]
MGLLMPDSTIRSKLRWTCRCQRKVMEGVCLPPRMQDPTLTT